jgi:hypothetical protein
MKKPNKPERKYDACSARVTKLKLPGARIKCRAVVYGNKTMLFLSDLIETCFPGIPFKKELKEQPMKVNVKKEQPGVRYLVSLEDFEQAYKAYIEATSIALKKADKKPTRVIAEQFEIPFETCSKAAVISDTIPGLEENNTPVLGGSDDVHVDLSMLKSFYSTPAPAPKAATEEKKDSAAEEKKRREQEEARLRSAIASCIDVHLVKCHGTDVDVKSPTYETMRSAAWVSLYRQFESVYSVYLDKKYATSLAAVGIGCGAAGKRPQYMQKLIAFDKKYNEQSLATLLEVAQIYFDIKKSDLK